MTNRAVLLQEIEALPTAYIDEVANFVARIKQRKSHTRNVSQIPETMLLSESSLSTDWNTPEEDEAWASL